MSVLWRKSGCRLFNKMREKFLDYANQPPGMKVLTKFEVCQINIINIRCFSTTSSYFSSRNHGQPQQEPTASQSRNFKSGTMINQNIGFIGGGNMAYAIGSGLVNREIVKADQILTSDLNPQSLNRWQDLGTSVTENNAQVLTQSDIVFICLKPHFLEPCAAQLKSSYIPTTKDKEKLLISVLAGVKLNILQQQFSFIKGLKIIRTMPNTPMQVGEGCTVYTSDSKVTQEDLDKVYLMLSALGVAEEVPESIIDAIAGVTSCGPAFCFTIIEALADGSVKQGVPRQMALRFAAQTILGAAKTVLVTEKHPAILRDEVCSPGGSTMCGVYELEKGNIRATLMNAVEASAKKNAALGNK